MPLLTAPVQLKSVNTLNNPVRALGPAFSHLKKGAGAKETRAQRIKRLKLAGRALDVRNVDIIRAGEPERRKGMVHRLGAQQSGLGTFIMPFGGICGRFLGRLVMVWPEGIYVNASPGTGAAFGSAPLASLGAAWAASSVVSWTYPDGGTEPAGDCTGVKLLRRLDETPDAPDDPEAVVIYEGTDATYTDTGVSDTAAAYYAAYATYPDGVVSLPVEASLPLVTVFSDNFNRPDGPAADAEHPWVTSAGDFTIVSNRILTLSGYADVPIPIAEYDPLSMQFTIANQVASYLYYWDPAEGLTWVSLRATWVGGKTTLAISYQGHVSWGATTGPFTPAAGSGVMKLRRSGNTLTGTYKGETVSTEWHDSPSSILYPGMGVGNNSIVNATDDYKVRAE